MVGVAANTQDTRAAPEQDAAQELGVGWLREELRWPDIEPREGHFDDTRYDRLVALAARRGLRILPLLYRTPRWLTAHPTRLPPSLPAWQRFVRHVVGRYGRAGTFWRAHPELDGKLAMSTYEVWNEPYLSYFSYGGIHPDTYARLVRASIEAGRSVDRGARFLAAAETDYRADDGSTRNWLDDLFAADPGLGRVLTAVAVHPYSQKGPLDTTAPRGQQFARIQDMLATLRRHGVRAPRPLWITELGWSTCPDHPPCVSLGDQRLFWRQVLHRIRTPPLSADVAAVFAYNLRNLGRTGPSDPLGDFGLIFLNGSHKPVWDEFHRVAADAQR